MESISLNEKELEKLKFAQFVGDQSNDPEKKHGVAMFIKNGGEPIMGVRHGRFAEDGAPDDLFISAVHHLVFEMVHKGGNAVGSTVYANHLPSPADLMSLMMMGVGRLVWSGNISDYLANELSSANFISENTNLKIQNVHSTTN